MNFNAEIEIDLDRLKYNVKVLVDTYGDYQVHFANVKNKAFGMGYGIINTLVNNGISYLYVSTLEEAMELRKINEKVNILVNFMVNPEYVYDAINNNITLTISDLNNLKEIANLDLTDTLNIHLLIDNGANKLGLKNTKEINEAKEIIKENPKINLEGVYTEFTTYGIIDENYYEAFGNFLNCLKPLEDYNLIVHVNEPMMYHRKNKVINGIRFDLSLLGIEENIDDDFISNMKMKSIDKKYCNLAFPNIDLDLIFSLKTEVIAMSKAFKNTLIGRNFVTKEDTLLAIIPIGHKDGITKAIKTVIINGKNYPVVADAIDYLTIAVDNSVRIKDKVEIINQDVDIYNVIGSLKTNRFYLMSILNNNLDRVYINVEVGSNLL